MAVNYINSVPKLVGRENFDEWCFAVENVFVLEGLSKCLDETETDTVLIAKAKAKLILTIDPSLYVHVKDATTCTDAWKKIKNLYEDAGFTRKIGLLRTLISLRLDNCESMESYVNQVIETAQKLRKTGFSINEEWIGSLLLAGLPDKFAPMLMAVEHAGIAITTDSIKSKLLDMPTGSSSNKSSAFVTSGGNLKNRQRGGAHGRNSNVNHQKTNNDRFDNKDKSKVICFKCKQPGHFMSKCPNLQSLPGTSHKTAFSAVFLSGNFNKNDFYLDSGASRHMTPNENWIKNSMQPIISEIIVANKETLPVKCSGEIDITTSCNGKYYDITVENVLCVPNLTTNLLSVSALISKGNHISFNIGGCSIYNSKNELVATADLIDGIYKLKLKDEKCMLTVQDKSEIWHRRLAHINSQDLNKMKNCVIGLELKGSVNIDKSNCIVCCEGKQSRQPFPNIGTRSTEILEVVHGDLCGPMEEVSIGGSRYFLLLVDDFSRMSFVYFLKAKSDAFEYFKEFKSMVENKHDKKIKVFRSDQGGEFCNNDFKIFLKNEGIIHQKTNAYTPQQNGLAERLNRTLVEKARCLLFDAGLSKKFWAEAINTSNFIRNRCIATGLSGKTPFEMWNKTKPDLSGIRIFGSTVMVHVPKEKRLKFDKKSNKHILVGFSEHIKGYRVYNPDSDDVTTSRDVVIVETMQSRKLNLNLENQEMLDEVGDNYFDNTLQSEDLDEDTLEHISLQDDLNDSDFIPDNIPMSADHQEHRQESIRRSERPKKEKTFDDYVTYLSTDCGTDFLGDAPMTVTEALSRPDRDKWNEAMMNEMYSLIQNETWDIVDPPERSTLVDCKWVFKVKFDCENKKSYRARLVAKGFTQKFGIDYGETFSPVVRHSTLRLLIALSVNIDLDIFHLDVTTAFLHGHLDETVFMKQPEGFVKVGEENKVLKLNKAIYGLKQSSRVWYKKVELVLENLDYNKSQFEPCIFIKLNKNLITVIALYVDDFFIFFK